MSATATARAPASASGSTPPAQTPPRTGSQALLEALHERGVEVCFANPGTTEMWLVAALDATPGIRPILGLHETVCAGAADGYARVARKPACTVRRPSTFSGNRAFSFPQTSIFSASTTRRVVAPHICITGQVLKTRRENDCASTHAVSVSVSVPRVSSKLKIPNEPPRVAPAPRPRPGERLGESAQRAPSQLARFELGRGHVHVASRR